VRTAPLLTSKDPLLGPDAQAYQRGANALD